MKLLWAFLVGLLACAAPARYTISLDPFTPPAASSEGKKVVVTHFTDERGLKEQGFIGSKGEAPTPIYLLQGDPALLLTQEVKDYLLQKGLVVEGESPSWDLTLEGLDPSWGPLVIGGKLRRLWVEVAGGPMPLCKAYVAVDFAVAKGRKVYWRKVELEVQQRLVRFKEERVAKLLEDLLGEAIERGLSDLEISAESRSHQ